MKRFDSDWSPICRRRAGQFRVLISAIEGGHHGDRWRKQGLLMQILFHDPLTCQRNNSILNLAFEFRWTSSCMQTCGWPQSNPHSHYGIYRQGLAARAKWTASRPGSWGGRLQNETTKGRSHFASACLIDLDCLICCCIWQCWESSRQKRVTTVATKVTILTMLPPRLTLQYLGCKVRKLMQILHTELQWIIWYSLNYIHYIHYISSLHLSSQFNIVCVNRV